MVSLNNPVGALLVDDHPTLMVSLCEGERVESVYVTDSSTQSGEGEILWKIVAEGEGVAMEQFIVGEVPRGFEEAVPLDRRAFEREITAWVQTDVELIGAVDFRSMEEGSLYVDLEPAPIGRLSEDRHCGDS